MTNHDDGRADAGARMAGWPPALRDKPEYPTGDTSQLDLASDVFPSRCMRNTDSEGRPIK
ncbi:MAG: hypothetical protein AAF367_01020 [Pseudomonadota bacterium]